MMYQKTPNTINTEEIQKEGRSKVSGRFLEKKSQEETRKITEYRSNPKWHQTKKKN